MAHWTDDHIIFEKETGYYVGYDEAGLQLHYSKNPDEVVAELEKYAETLKEENL